MQLKEIQDLQVLLDVFTTNIAITTTLGHVLVKGVSLCPRIVKIAWKYLRSSYYAQVITNSLVVTLDIQFSR